MFRKVFLFCALVLTMASGSAMAAQKISVASDCTWPPMEFLDENKQPIGFSVDLLREMGKELGVEFDIKNVSRPANTRWSPLPPRSPKSA